MNSDETVVLKFGGTSVGSIDLVKSVAQVVKRKLGDFKRVVVVVSAMGHTTDKLIEEAYAITPRPNERDVDMLLATGEQMSSALLSIALQAIDVPSIALTGAQAGFKTIGRHRKNKIENLDISRIKGLLNDYQVIVVSGFQGINSLGDITTLGRGGSDTSAVALAAQLGVSCEIYTDVDGIYTTDPRICQKAKRINHLTYEETIEMAHLGTKVIEPRSVEMAERYEVPLYLGLNTGSGEGTLIMKEVPEMERTLIKNVSVLKDILLVTMTYRKEDGINLADIFKKLADAEVNIDVINHNQLDEGTVKVTFTCTSDDRYEVEAVLDDLVLNYELIDGLAKVSVVGTAMRHQSGVAARVFKLFDDNQIDFYQVTTSEISLSYLIDKTNVTVIVPLLLEAFELD